MSELEHRPENEKWLWKGYLSRGGVTVLSALWKAGKSTLLSHLLRACDGRSSEFLGREIVPFRVLYVSEEHEEMWADRRDELGIRDHVGLISRPFKGRASPAEWAAFVGKVAGVVVEHQFDLLVIDTISKMWPVRDENDAGQVEEALMPLWTITNTGAAMLLVHHNRKSGGKEFTGMRGSGGLPAFAETLIEFGRHSEHHKDCRRVLYSEGRYRESSGKILIELKSDGYHLVSGDYDDPGVGFGRHGQAEPQKVGGLVVGETHQRVLAVLPDDETDAVSMREIARRMSSRGWPWVAEGRRRAFLTEMMSQDVGLVMKAEEGDGYFRTPKGAAHAAASGASDPTDLSEAAAGKQGDSDESMVLPTAAADVSQGAESREAAAERIDIGPDLMLAIQKNGPQASPDLAALTGCPESEVVRTLARYLDRGVLLRSADGVYSLAPKRSSK